MSVREMAVRALGIFFALVTLITIAIMVMGLAFDAQTSFGYEAFASPLIFAAVGVIPTLVMYSRHELSIREVLIRKVFQLALVEALILAIAFNSPAIPTNSPGLVAALAGVIAAVFLAANAFAWLAESASARKLTVELKEMQEHLASLETM